MLRKLKNRIHFHREARIHGPASQIESGTLSAPYEYSPLNAANDEIRILTILPATFGTDVRILINKTRLADDFQPGFEALSYAWGSADNASHVRVGVSGNVTLSITPNLAEALQYLRYTDRPRVFWIDAICVNQRDLNERSQQVKRMADIFSKADRVVAWLGPSENQSSLALRTMGHLGSSLRVDWRLFRMTSAPGSDPSWAELEVPLPYDDEIWAAILHLVKRSWFERLWIYQEVHLARQGCLIMCGFDTIPWSDFRNACQCLRIKARNRTDFRHLENAHRLSSLAYGRLGVRKAIESTENSKCSDNRDKIYAIASLCINSHRRLILPDYAKSVQNVYKDLVLKFVSERHELDLLSTCNLRTVLHGSPTWVPNWSVPNAWTTFTDTPLSSTYSPGAAYDGHGVLSVTGLFCGTVDTVHDCSDIDSWDYHSLRDFAPKDTIDSLYLGGGTMLEAFCRTVFANHFGDRFSDQDAGLLWPESNAVMNFVAQILDPDTNSISDIRLPKSLKSLQYLRRRSFFTTRNGYFGIAPAGIAPGDCVSVILGVDGPLILHPIHDKKYQVVGAGFISGLMYHEALLGHLPDIVRPVHTCLEDDLGGDGIGFRDSKTGRVFLEDPRAGPLPEGWKRNVQGWAGGSSHFENITTGEVSVKDPRLGEEALRARGVELVKIDLV